MTIQFGNPNRISLVSWGARGIYPGVNPLMYFIINYVKIDVNQDKIQLGYIDADII